MKINKKLNIDFLIFIRLYFRTLFIERKREFYVKNCYRISYSHFNSHFFSLILDRGPKYCHFSVWKENQKGKGFI